MVWLTLWTFLGIQSFFFPSNPQPCSCLQLCRFCVCLCVCVCTSMYTEAENQFFIANTHMESAQSEHQTTLWKQRSLFILSYSSYCLLDRSRPKWAITVFCSDLEVAAALHWILPCTKSIKGESKICNKSK